MSALKVMNAMMRIWPQRRFLLEAGCDEFQGFLYAPALDTASFEQRLASAALRPVGAPRMRLVRD